MRRLLTTMVLAAAAGALFFAYKDELENFFAGQLIQSYPRFENLVKKIERKPLPCEQPITYTIASFDARFGISQSDFLRAVREAEQIWEKPIERELFAYASSTSTIPGTGGTLKINLTYDARQDATITLRKYGITIRDSQESYTALKTAYGTLKDEYEKEQTIFESRLAALKHREDQYNEEVTSWNSRGGAPPEVYNHLNEEKTAIDYTIAEIDKIQDDLNIKVERINAMVVVLNRLAATLNIQVARYNEIGDTHAGEFEEGVYRSNQNGREIDIYQFDDRAKLVRVLAHELGHSLGLDHLANPKAIMYRLNQGTNEKPTPDDLAALKKRCGIQ